MKKLLVLTIGLAFVAGVIRAGVLVGEVVQPPPSLAAATVIPLDTAGQLMCSAVAEQFTLSNDGTNIIVTMQAKIVLPYAAASALGTVTNAGWSITNVVSGTGTRTANGYEVRALLRK